MITMIIIIAISTVVCVLLLDNGFFETILLNMGIVFVFLLSSMLSNVQSDEQVIMLSSESIEYVYENNQELIVLETENGTMQIPEEDTEISINKTINPHVLVTTDKCKHKNIWVICLYKEPSTTYEINLSGE